MITYDNNDNNDNSDNSDNDNNDDNVIVHWLMNGSHAYMYLDNFISHDFVFTICSALSPRATSELLVKCGCKQWSRFCDCLTGCKCYIVV